MRPLGLYIHVPFCEVACRYCNFFFVARRPDLYAGYVEALRKELVRWAHDPRVAGRAVETVYLGGGTPSVLSGGQVQAILDDVRKLYQVERDAEVTLEANPGTLHDRKLAEIRAAGVTRLSIGVQSFQDDELRMIWRTHTSEESSGSIEAARRAGFDNISIDLMFAIPRQTMERWEASLARAVSFTPEHISIYCLTVEEGTPLAAHIAEGKVPKAAEEFERDLFLRGMEFLEEHGYEQYEVSNFARDGRYSRHNLGCWERGEYLGIGPGAHGYLDPERWGNLRSVDGYIRRMATGEDVREMRETLDEEKARLEVLWLGLRTKWGLDLGAYRSRFGRDLGDTHREVIAELGELGHARVEDGRLRLTRKGRLLADAITPRLI